ncbi:hypothetical protein CYY_004827 [Polysphondylium violaceum]|uniref:DUF814 family protein n=1 Tax=Polysphondylium violaceum TaxID=133409 RepID=A0A8J4PUH7_9MYCE|nr:hypothetical protein CYY_004827 [Polysphondylium violaceum]
MKTRFSSIDIRTTVFNLQKTLIGLRLANLYDLSPRVFLFKFSKPDFKKTLIIESGIRIHSTNFVRDKGDHTPAPFTLALRKYLKTKRLESVKQLGVDRIVDFTFGSGVAVQHLIIELYSIGNIILTDGDYKILAILRTHQYNQDESVGVGDTYPVDRVKKPTEFTTDLIEHIIQASDKKENLKQVFNKSLDFGPELIEHCLLEAGLQPSMKLEQYDHAVHSKSLIESFKQGQKIYDQSTTPKGFIVLKDPKVEKKQQQQKKQQQAAAAADSNNNNEEKKELVIYEEFVPFLYKQYQAKKYLEYDSFDQAVDQFFSEIESQKLEQQRIAQEQAVLKKLDKVKEDQQRRVETLFQAEANNVRKAELIEANLQEVDQCITIIRSGVAASMSWSTLDQLLKEEKKKNPYSVATMIHRLKLESNQITLLLNDNFLYDDDDQDEDDEDDDDDQDDDNDDDQDEEKKKKKEAKENRKPVMIDVDISLSAFANARKYYDSKKQSHEKAQKTLAQAEFAYKAAEKKTRQQLSEVKSKSSMLQMRKVFWFEKFHWFISSDNYIVVSGRDAQQNELLYKKYLEKDDIYIHADIFGSTSCVIKNPSGGEIPPSTLIQAGTMTMCYSNAWSAKVVTSAYWVHAHQVSKTAPSGEYLTTGSFMIRGKKNYLPHSQLVMGFGFMFKIDESCLGFHLNERKSSMANDQDQDDLSESHHDSAGAIIDDSNPEKRLRKFERTKLRKEQKEQKEIEDLASLALQDNNDDDQITITNQAPAVKEDESVTSTTTTTTTTTATGIKDDKYRIKLVSSFQDDLEDEEKENEEKQQKSKAKGHISAHQRKLLKKGVDINDTDSLKQLEEEKKQQQQQKQQQEEQSKKEKAEPQKHLLPSQKNKLKKIKEKYGHQDEEERKERMELLGSMGSNKKDNKKDKNKKDKKKNNNNKNNKDNSKDNKDNKSKDAGKKDPQQSKKEEVKKEEPIPITTPTTTTTTTTTSTTDNVDQKPKESAPTTSTTDNDNESEGSGSESEESDGESKQEKRKTRKEKREQKLKEEEEIKQLLEEENSAKAVDDQKDITNIDTLTGIPREEDILHFAIPVVAPYSVFNNYKYKVKLTPGHLKRGKAAKQAAQVLLQSIGMTKREKELIKNIKDEDLTSNMLADVRLHAPNILAMQKKEKKQKKQIAIEKAHEAKEAKDKENSSSSTPTTTTTSTTTSSTQSKK